MAFHGVLEVVKHPLADAFPCCAHSWFTALKRVWCCCSWLLATETQINSVYWGAIAPSFSCLPVWHEAFCFETIIRAYWFLINERVKQYLCHVHFVFFMSHELIFLKIYPLTQNRIFPSKPCEVKTKQNCSTHHSLERTHTRFLWQLISPGSWKSILIKVQYSVAHGSMKP